MSTEELQCKLPLNYCPMSAWTTRLLMINAVWHKLVLHSLQTPVTVPAKCLHVPNVNDVDIDLVSAPFANFVNINCVQGALVTGHFLAASAVSFVQNLNLNRSHTFDLKPTSLSN